MPRIARITRELRGPDGSIVAEAGARVVVVGQGTPARFGGTPEQPEVAWCHPEGDPGRIIHLHPSLLTPEGA